jgi:DNA-binding response OmpR family regulator
MSFSSLLKMPKKILHADDELETLKLVKEILGKMNCQVVSVPSGIACLKEFEGNKFDLVLLDIMMPDLSGWDVFEKIRSKDKQVKVAFLSVVEVSKERLDKLKKEGLNDYITKPFLVDEFKKRVTNLLN